MKSTNSYALITGASSGLGSDFARLFAQKGINLILVARREGNLKSLAQQLTDQYGVQAHVLAKDLSKTEEVNSIFPEVQSHHWEVDYLINNAGFGETGDFITQNKERLADMLEVNMKALTLLTHDFLPSMIQRKTGKVMLVASTASFQPGPGMAVYFATKSYVRSLGEALSYELRNTGVSLTILCPGPTQTEFIDNSGMKSISLVSFVKMPSSMEVAEFGFKSLMAGKRTVVHGALNKLGSVLTHLLPTGIILRVLHKLLKS